MIRSPIVVALLGGIIALSSFSVTAQEITRNKTPGSDFPIAQSVQVPGASELIFVSGAVPKPIVEGGDPNDSTTYGDTEVQTVSVLTEVQSRLQRLGLDMGDVVMMRAYLVGTPETEDRMDFSGFMRGYTQFFGTEEQPHLPSRSAFQIAGLARAGWFVEIEVVAARAP
ncbi:MAG: enamine deaminase RidA (YjgF/YER057c/UK114 family) [Glaciecola sp.]|jgi:enamine deaminase RidA (YjgF/YER057c/UK114 family)|uniref:RidA family protein n=1 Tax=Congregibacter sp. TaxID=2744308 RepID=UPI0039E430C3